jgi:hypothetical protein
MGERSQAAGIRIKDGEVIIKNVKPKTAGCKHEVIDETFRDSASFKDTEAV